jgi:hypothetical protein
MGTRNSFGLWWRYAGSNRGPLACHASALPAELYPRPKEAGIIGSRLPAVKRCTHPKPPAGGNGRGFGRNRKGSGEKLTAGRVSRAIFYRPVDIKRALYHIFIVFLSYFPPALCTIRVMFFNYVGRQDLLVEPPRTAQPRLFAWPELLRCAGSWQAAAGPSSAKRYWPCKISLNFSKQGLW